MDKFLMLQPTDFFIFLQIWLFYLSPDCGGVLNRPAGGNFSSPGYLVSNYSNNLNCEWLIENPQHVNSSIVVLLEDLHVQNDQTCEKDFLLFRLGESNILADVVHSFHTC